MYHYHRNTPIPPLRSPSTLSNYHLSFTWIYHLIPHSNPSVTSYSGELHVRMLRKCNRWTHTDFCRLCSQRQREFQARRIVVDSKPYQRIQKGVSRGDQSTGSAWCHEWLQIWISLLRAEFGFWRGQNGTTVKYAEMIKIAQATKRISLESISWTSIDIISHYCVYDDEGNVVGLWLLMFCWYETYQM